jgi:hypothetical protein
MGELVVSSDDWEDDPTQAANIALRSALLLPTRVKAPLEATVTPGALWLKLTL